MSRLMPAASLLVLSGLAGAQAIHHVDHEAPGPHDGTSWTRAFLEPGAALAAAAPGDGIWVAEGSYTPPPTGFALADAVKLYGGFVGYTTGPGGFETSLAQADPDAHPTVFDGDLGGGAHASVAVAATNVGAETVLDGVMITGVVGRGLACTNSDLQVADCRFIDNATPAFGFSLFGAGAWVSLGSPVFRRCTFEGNVSYDGGAGAACFTAAPRFVDCTFDGNTAHGAGSADGRGGGLLADDGALLTLKRCVLVGNAAEDGGGLAVQGGSVARLMSCAVVGNWASENGGGVFQRNTDVSGQPQQLINCTVAYNTSVGPGGGVYHVQGASPDHDNCILWGNVAQGAGGENAQIVSSGDSHPTFDWCCVEGWSGVSGGQGNIAGPALFVPGGFDLQWGSACIDAGRNASLLDNGPLDVLRRTRLVNDVFTWETGLGAPPVVDMGACEFQADCNRNGVPDAADVLAGTEPDLNGNGAPDICEGEWTNAQNGLPGTGGTPQLVAWGILTLGHPVNVVLQDARPNAAAALVLGLSRIDAPFKGGVMVPAPDIVVAGVQTDGAGEIALAFPWPDSVPPSFTVWWQWWIWDDGGPYGFAASNGLGSTPGPWGPPGS